MTHSRPSAAGADNIEDLSRAGDRDVEDVGPFCRPTSRAVLRRVRRAQDQDHGVGLAALNPVDRADTGPRPFEDIGDPEILEQGAFNF